MYVQDINDVIHKQPLWHGEGWFLSCSKDELPSLHVPFWKGAKAKATKVLKANGFKAKILYEMESMQFYPHANEVMDGATLGLRFLDRVPVPTVPRPTQVQNYFDEFMPAVFRQEFFTDIIWRLVVKNEFYSRLSKHLMIDPIMDNAVEETQKRLKYLKINLSKFDTAVDAVDRLGKSIFIDKARLIRSKMNVSESFEELFT